MKKFLTVLLALSVVFTYSFSAVETVFAATDTEKASLLLDAKENAEKAVNTCFDEAMKNVKDRTFASYTESKTKEDYADAWKAIDAKARVLAAIEEKYNAEVSGGFSNYPTANATAEDYADDVFGINYESTDTLSGLTTEVADYIWKVTKKEVLYNLYVADRDEAVSALKNVDWSLYSDTKTNANGQTYLAEAQEKVAAAEEYLNNNHVYTLEEVKNTPASDLQTAIDAVQATVTNGTNVAGFDGVTPTYYDEANKQYPTGMYKVNGVDTIKDLDDSEITGAATAAQVKATAQQAYAEYVVKSGADKEFAKAYVDVVSYLADEKVLPVAGTTFAKEDLSTFDATSIEKFKDAVANAAEMDAFATKYAAEKNADGELVRDAEEVAGIADAYQLAEYKYAVNLGTQPTKKTYEDKIIAATVKSAEAGLAFKKELAKKKLADAKDAIIDNYYPLEATKVEANYAKVLEKIEAATDETKIPADTTFNAALTSGAADKDTVDGKVSYSAGTAAKADYDAVVAYAKYANSGKNPLADDYIVYDQASIQKALNTLYGEQGARTNAEIAALNVDAAAIAAKLPTVGGLAAAKKAAEDAIAALPAKITPADKDAVVAAWEAKEAYVAMGGKATDLKDNANGTLTKAIGDLKTAMRTDFAIQGIKVDKTDKAALNDLIAKIDEANNLFGDGAIFGKVTTANPDFTNASLTKAKNDIRDAELANVKKLINAIPVNVTEADRATVEAARKAFDAFVEEWTSYDPEYYAAGYVDNFRELALAEAALGLNDSIEQDIYGTHVKINSKAGKGYIKISWGQNDNGVKLDGYEVYRSTKKNSGFKKISTFKVQKSKKYTKGMKKGTKYYFYVKGYKMVGDEKVYAHDSIKVYRTFRK